MLFFNPLADFEKRAVWRRLFFRGYSTVYLTAGLRLGEGSGAVAALPLLDMALAVYHSGHSFTQLGIDAYTPQN